MKKLLILFITPLISVLLVVTDFDDIKKYLNTFPSIWRISVESVIVLLTVILYAINIIIPFLSNEKIATKRWSIISKVVAEIDDLFKEYELCYNIMIPKYSLINKLEPIANGSKETKWKINTPIFKKVWEGGNHSIPKGFKFTVNQGMCGKAYNSGSENIHLAIYSKRRLKNYNFNFNEKQNELTKYLRFIASIAIIQEIDEPDSSKKVVIGVFNIQSTKMNSEQLFTIKANNNIITEKLFRLVNILKDII